MSTNPYANPDYGNDKDKKEGGKAAANPYKDEKYGEARGFTGQAKDIGVSLLEGAVSVPEAAVGVADMFTGGRAGKLLENKDGAVGFRPGEAKEIIADQHTEDYKYLQQQFADADGVIDKAGVAITNPSMIANTVAQSLPAMGAGAVAGRGLQRVAGKRKGADGVETNRLSDGAAAAAGEGLTMAGMQAEEIRQETDDGLLTGKQIGLSGLTGVAGTLFAWGGNKLAKKLGVGDVDELILRGMRPDHVAGEIASAPAKSIPRQIIEGAITEGFLEELPQSVSETILQNLALDKPWHEGVEDAAVMGTLAGMAMGGAGAGYSGYNNRGADTSSGLPDADIPPAGDAPKGFSPSWNAPPVVPEQYRRETLSGQQQVAPKPSEVMGINPDAGPLSSAAATAVDSGASQQVSHQEALAQAAQEAERVQAEQPKQPEQKPQQREQQPILGLGEVVDPETGEVTKSAEALQQRIDYINNQAQMTGWTKGLVDARTEATQELNKLLQEQGRQETDAQPQQEPEVEQVPQAQPVAESEPAEQGKDEKPEGRTEEKPANLQEGIEQAQVKAAAAESEAAGAPADIRAIIAKQIPDMTDAEIRQAIEHYGPDHKRTKKLEKALAKREGEQKGESYEDAKAKVAEADKRMNAASEAIKKFDDTRNDMGMTPDDVRATPEWQAAKNELEAARKQQQDANANVVKNFPKEHRADIDKRREEKVSAAQPDSQQEPEGLELVTIKDIDGNSHTIRKSDLDGDRDLIKTYTKDGKRKEGGLVHRGNLDPIGERHAEQVAQMADNPLFNVITTKSGAPFKSKVAAGREMNKRGLSGTHEVVKASELGAAGDGYVVRKKGSSEQQQADNESMPDAWRESMAKALEAVPADHPMRRKWEANAEHGLKSEGDRAAVLKQVREAGEQTDQPAIARKVFSSKAHADWQGQLMKSRALINELFEAGYKIVDDIAELGMSVTNARAKGNAERLAQHIYDKHVGSQQQPEQKPVTNQDMLQAGIDSGRVEIVTVGDKKPKKTETKPKQETKAAEPQPEPKAEHQPAAPAAETEAKDQDRFAGNKLFTADKVAAARARMKSKFGQLNSGLDPEMLIDGMTVAGAYIESGIRNFSDYAKAMIEDFGDGVKPYLLSFWEGARNYPGLDTEGMSTPNVSKIKFEKLLSQEQAAEIAPEAVGEIEQKPAKRTRKTGKDADMVLTQDWGVEHIDGYSDSNARETGNATKDAFLKEARKYLNAVADVLADQGYETYRNKKGKADKAVSVSEGGVAGSGDLHLEMRDPENSKNVYIHVGDTSLRGVVPTTDSGIAIMYRVGDDTDRQALKAGNTWAPVDLSASDLAGLILSKAQAVRTKPEAASNEQPANEDADQGGAPEVRGGGRSAQPGSAQADSGNVAQGQPADGAAAGEAGDSGRPGVREPRTDVAGDGRVSEVGDAGDGRTRTGRAGSPDAGTRADGTAGAKGGTGSRGGNAAPVTSPAATSVQAQDLHIENPLEVVGGTPVQRFNRNRAALELLQTLEEEGRQATAEEQKTLAGYTGWGSFGQDLFQGSWDHPVYRDEGVWKERGQWLRDTLGESAWKSAQRSITNAHYTDPPTVMAMWDMVRRMGFKGGRVLEPSLGTGNFYSMMPADLKARSELTGIELDETTGAIAKQLFPKSNIRIMGYQQSQTPDNFYDLVIGNWPFENTPIADRRYNKLNPMLHDYFFLKTMDQVRPGGIVIGITSAGSMDKQNTSIRRELARQAELVASIRLPSGAFEDYAGTSVVTDIVILRKRPERLVAVPEGSTWVETTKVGTQSGNEVRVNQYYADNPQNIIGTLDFDHGTTTFRAGMVVRRPDNMAERLKQAVEMVPEGAMQERQQTDHLTYYANETGERHGSLAEVKGKLMVAVGDQIVEANQKAKYQLKDEKKTEAREQELKAIIGVRRMHSALVDAERQGQDAKAARKDLRDAYQGFVKEHGPIRESFALNYLRRIEDPFYAEVAALENDDGTPAAVMERSTTRSKRSIKNPTVRDAYVLARNQAISPDIEDIAKLANKPADEVRAELLESGAVFEAPNGDIVPSDIYLSGNVREKLREAQAAVADGNSSMQKNVDALTEVVPEDIPYFNIETKVGATWVSNDVYAQYISHMLGRSNTDGIEVAFRSGRWKVRLDSNLNKLREASTNYGTEHYTFSQLVQAAMSNQTLRLRSRDSEGNEYYDQAKSEEANARLAKIREDFASWLWSDPERRQVMEREYNESRNAWATPKYDGSFLTFEGMALTLGDGEFNLRKHQVDAIWRAIVNRRSLNAHEVGTGKTFTMGGIAVESRRYGLAKKPVILAHNANSATVAAEIRMMYPSARVLYVDNLDAKNREVRLRQIANDDWDAIVIPHSLIDRMSLREETLMQMAADDIADLESEFFEAAREDGVDPEKVDLNDDESIGKIRSVTAKELAKARKRIIESIKKQAQQSSKEGAVTFEDLGIDMILVDEVHEFKKPPIVTRMQMKGLNTQVSQQSIGLQFLTRYVRQINNGGNVHTFTGTPITNTITEIYHQMRYVMESEMEQAGVADWDGWFGSFATEVQDVELSAAGDYEMVTRLAGFVNVPELRQMAGQYMDTVFAEDMPEMKPREVNGKRLGDDSLTDKERAELLNGRTEGAKDRPYKKVVNESADMTDKQSEVFREIQGYAKDWRDAGGKQRMEWMRKGDPRSPIVTEGIANKASFDVRLLDESLAGMEGKTQDDPNSKASRVVNQVLEIYNSHPQAGQVIFAEQGFSKSVRRSKSDGQGGRTSTTHKVFSTIHDIVERLVQGGIPREQIAIVDGNTKKEKRKEIALAMNEGTMRVVIGSTDTLGVGVNMQRNLRAMHHMDAPYMPGELEQRNGRGQRQGNQWNTVMEYRYMTDRLDGRRWQILAVKQRFINAFMKSHGNVRVIEGEAAADEQSDILESFSEAAGDPRILQRAKLQKKEESLMRKERMYTQGIADMRRQVRSSKEAADRANRELAAVRDSKRLENIAGLIESQREQFRAEIGGRKFDSRKDAAEGLAAYIEANIRMGDRAQAVGTYGGQELMVEWRNFDAEPVTIIRAFGESFDGKGIAGAEARMRNYPSVVEKIEIAAEQAQATADNLSKAMEQPFGQAEELARVSRQLEDIEQDLAVNPVPPPAWLRQGAPVDSEVFRNKRSYVVTGHRYSKDGWFVVAEDDKGTTLIPYMEAVDEAGMQLYEEREFVAPEVIEKAGAPKDGDEQPVLEKGDRYEVVSYQGNEDGPWLIHTEGGFPFDNNPDGGFKTADEAVAFAKEITGNDPERKVKGWDIDGSGVQFSFAGQKSGTAMHGELAKAKRMAARGVGNEDIRQATGWHRGADGKWRYEISDHDAKLAVSGKNMGEVIDMATIVALTDNRKQATIGDVMDHPALFRAYPGLADIQVRKMDDPSRTAIASVRVTGKEFIISLNPRARGDYALSALLHELQHAIQTIEGFARGGNARMAARLANLSVPSKAAANAYMRLSGEVEARNTQARMRMDDEFRKLFPPSETQDVSDADAIVTFNGSEVQDFTAADPITKQELREVFTSRFPRLAKALDGMLAKGDKRESGGLVILDSADPLRIAGQFSKITGRNLNESIRLFSNAEDAQGFFDPRSGLTFLVGPSVNETNAAAVVLHEAIHGQQNKKLDQAAVQMLVNRKKEKSADTRAFLDRVVRRMSRAEGGVTELEAAAYIVEQAIMEGRDGSASQQIDAGLIGWIERNLGKTVADLVRGFVRAYRQFAIRNGLGLNVTVDDMIQYAQASMRQTAREGAQGSAGQRSGNAIERSTGDASPEEARRVQQAIEGGSLVGAARFLTQSSDKARAAVARKVLDKLEAMEKSGVNLELNVVHVGDSAPDAMASARAYTEMAMDSKGRDVVVWVNGADVAGKVGVEEEALLHELVHAATAGALLHGSKVDGSPHAEAARAVYDAAGTISEYINNRFQQAERGQVTLTPFEQDMRDGYNNAFRNMDEVVAWAMTNREAQQYLDGIPSGKNRTLWTRFVEAVRSYLGLPATLNSVLSEVLAASEQLMDVGDTTLPSIMAFWHKRNARMITQQAAGKHATAYGVAGARAEGQRQFAETEKAIGGRKAYDKAKAEGKTKLNYQQWVQVRTPAFKEWFGDWESNPNEASKVIDAETGEPLEVYHGTKEDFTEFKAKTGGIYFTEDGTAATAIFTEDGRGDVGEYFLQMKAPFDARWKNMNDSQKAELREIIDGTVDDSDIEDAASKLEVSLEDADPFEVFTDGEFFWGYGRSLQDKVIEAIKDKGYDGVIFPDSITFGEEHVSYVSFKPSQIKSATGNAGTFSTETGDIRFSRSGIKGMAGAATAELNRTFNAPGKLSLWHKTIGTMYNLAERSPHFKPVFEAAQGFIDDVAHFATDAAELAPTLLPSLETWRDIAKKPITSKDNAAIAKPIFEGTLSWTRDDTGKPVRLEDGDDAQAGIVWTDDELRSMFDLNDKQAQLYHEFREATNRSLDTMARADMLRFGGKDLKAVQAEAMDAADVHDAARVIVRHLKELADENPDRKTELMQTAHGIAERAERVQELQDQGYAPLSRFGKYTVDVVVDGERQYFGLFETMREANKMKEAMAAEFGAGNVSQGTLSNETYKLFAGVTPETLELFGNMLGLDSDGDAAQDKAFQDYLRLTKTNRSAMRRLIHRKGIAGYSEDVGRVLASFVYSNSRQTAAGLNIGDLGDAINAIPKEQGELKDAAVRLGEYIKNPQEEGQVIRGFLFAQYLGGSVASAFVNLTQPVQVTFPWLTQFTSATNAAAQLGKAAKQMGTRGLKYEADLAAALKAAEDDGTVSPQEIHQLMGQARGKGSLKAGDGTRAGEARAAMANATARLSLAWGKLFSSAEQVNRRITFIAAYRIAREANMADPAGFARRAVRETQFVYSKAAKMQWGRGAVGGTLMTFKTYSVSYIELMHRLWTQGEPGSVERAQGRKAAMVMIATLFLISGAGGLPFAEDAEDLIDGAAQLMGYNFSIKKAREDFMAEVFGDAIAEFIDKGVSGLPGAPMDVSGRLGLGNLIPGTGLFQERTSHTRDVLEILGPGGDFVDRVVSGGRKVLGGNVTAGMLEMSPVAVRNLAKGTDMAVHGMYRDNKGYKVLDTNILEAAAKAAGFQPATVAKIQEANWINQRAKNYYSMRAQEIRQMWASGIFEKNQNKVQQARQAIADWNAKNPDQPMLIRIPDVMRRVREMAKTKDERIAATAPKAMRQQMREDLARVRETL